jgi:hypothetical protein
MRPLFHILGLFSRARAAVARRRSVLWTRRAEVFFRRARGEAVETPTGRKEGKG